MKVMYPCRLGPETKCPNCHTRIISIGGTLYSCQNGHVIECVVMVTLNKAQHTTTPVLANEESIPQPPRQFNQTAIQTDEPILPPKDKMQ